MKLSKLFLTTLLSFISFISFSQEECGTDELIRRNPFLQQMYEERVACAPEVDLDTAQVLTIPVVFHIIHLGEPVGEGTNISDEQVLSCIDNLNHRFRGDVNALSELTDEYDEYELSLVMDSKIEFCLASRDPDDNPTNGIIRHDGSDITYTYEFSGQVSSTSYAERGILNGAPFHPISAVPDDYIKDLFHWPVDKYFNFYVVTEIDGNNALNGVQGYSYVGSLGTGLTGYRYGPVCLYNVTGTVGELKPGRTLNATWTHEVGHALNLYHTFGVFGGNCNPETNPCNQGDQVVDTPHTSSNQSCGPPECPDAIIENYMDYTSENCRIMFTQGQIERMREEIWDGLPYLVSDDNVSCQSPNSKDLGISTVTLPQTWCLDTVSFSVKILNYGGDISEDAILYVNNSPQPIPSINGGESVTIDFIDYPIGDGIFEIEIEYPIDEYIDNNTYYHEVDLSGGSWLEFVITTDNWANEIDWEITNELGNIILYGGDYPFGINTYTYGTCLPDGCYNFVITDANGDGICSFDLNNDGICDVGGSLSLKVNGNTLLSIDPDNADYGSILELDFCATYCPPSPCKGDFNGDGLVTIRDLIELLAITGLTIDECNEYDLNNNFVIDVDDVLEFLQIMGYNCYTGEYYEVGMIPVNTLKDFVDLDVLDLNKTVIDVRYYTLRGERLTFNRYLSNGVYLKETLYSDGTKDMVKIFINER
jgi:hypothetical protein